MECRQLAKNQTLGTRAIWHLHQEFKYGTVVGLYFIVHGYEVSNLCINYFRQWCNYKFWPRTWQEFVFSLSPQTTAFKNKILMMDMRNSPESTSHKKSYQHLAQIYQNSKLYGYSLVNTLNSAKFNRRVLRAFSSTLMSPLIARIANSKSRNTKMQDIKMQDMKIYGPKYTAWKRRTKLLNVKLQDVKMCDIKCCMRIKAGVDPA